MELSSERGKAWQEAQNQASSIWQTGERKKGKRPGSDL